MIQFKCDHCDFTTTDPKDIITTNILHLAKDRAGADKETTTPLLPTPDYTDYCNACFRQLRDWVNGGLRQWIVANFPLVKNGTNTVH